MSRNLPQPGDYQARRYDAIVVREEESGSLMAYIPCLLIGSEPADFKFTHALCLGSKDGVVQQRNIETLKTIFPDWDGLDPFGLEEIPLPEGEEPEFDLGDCFHDDSYTPEGSGAPVIQFKAQWLNPLGGGRPKKEPMTEAEKKQARTKWAGKFKAISGKPAPKNSPAPHNTAKPAVKSSAPARNAPPARGGKAASEARTSTQEEVWEGLKSKFPKEKDDKLAEKFYAAQDEVSPDANGELTAEQWGEVATNLGI